MPKRLDRQLISRVEEIVKRIRAGDHEQALALIDNVQHQTRRIRSLAFHAWLSAAQVSLDQHDPLGALLAVQRALEASDTRTTH